MFELFIQLKHIILEPENPIDLTTLPEKEAIEMIVKSYGFLSSAIQVSISKGVAHIHIDEPRSGKINEALNHLEKGVKEAQRGEYQKSIKSFSKVLETIPQHVDARRNLAMAYLEMGKTAPAKELLQECLKLDPTNIWSFVLLGNIYGKHEHNLDAAAFYYEAGLAINPSDNFLLNNFAALQMERGKFSEAKDLFDRALTADPDYPNTYLGLAMLHNATRSYDRAIELLERLFDRSKSSDIRSEPVYQNARALYGELCNQLAIRDSDKLMASVISGKQQLETATGHPISIEEDSSLEYVSATAQMAWKHGRNEHRVRYVRNSPAVMPHLLAHELEHIVLEHEARMDGNNRLFCSTAKTREHAIRSVSDHIVKLQKLGYSEESLSSVIQKLVHGLCNQVFNCPLDMVVEFNIFQKYPDLRYSQFVSLRKMHEDALKTYTSQEIKRLTPSPIFRASVTLNAAYALFIDHIYGSRTNYAASYRNFENFSIARNLFDLWKKKSEIRKPGEEYELVDEFAKQLKLLSWYEWQSNNAPVVDDSKDDLVERRQPLTTNNPDAYRYCLDALRRFDGKSRDQIFDVLSEVSILGMTGIKPDSSEEIYSLKAYEGEKFTGLHLLCIMYVGFKIIEPELNTELDFSEAYQLALQARRAMLQ